MNNDALVLVYEENDVRVVLGEILTNHSMTVDEALDLLDIDMDKVAENNGWDDWNYEALKLEAEEENIDNLLKLNDEILTPEQLEELEEDEHVVNIENCGNSGRYPGKIWYNVILENGTQYSVYC